MLLNLEQGSRSAWAERILVLAGGAALLYCGAAALEMHGAQRAAAALSGPAVFPEGTTRELHEVAFHRSGGAVIGRIEIPQLGISAPIISGIGTDDLIRGVGHVPGTAMPGGLGTMGLAGHRDTFFRALQNVQPAMEIRVVGGDGRYRYQIDSTEIVTPDQVEVVATRSRPELALITCYPFRYIGAAPKRFIVHAHLLSVAGD